MAMTYGNRIAATLMSLFLAAVSAASGQTVEEVLAGYCRAREATVALETKFTQRKILTLFDEEEIAKGTLYFAHPDRIRWQYSEPDRSTTVINGNWGWSVLHDIKQVQRFRLDGSTTNKVLSIVGFGSCGGSLRESFAISLGDGGKGGYLLEMTPTDAQIRPYFSRVDILIDRSDYLPRKIEMHERSGDLLVFEFENLDRESIPDSTLFEFALPEGFELVEY